MELLNKIRDLIRTKPKMFSHDGNGESCCVCGKPMLECLKVGSGERMHHGCYGGFLHNRVDEISRKHRAG